MQELEGPGPSFERVGLALCGCVDGCLDRCGPEVGAEADVREFREVREEAKQINKLCQSFGLGPM